MPGTLRSVKLKSLALVVGLLASAAVLSACQDGTSAVEHARSQIGTSYSYGSESPEDGFDCSGLVYWAYQQTGAEVPRTSSSLYGYTERIDRDELLAGDLVFYGWSSVHHVAIYTGEGTLVHAPSSGEYVREESIDTYWTDHLIGYGRLP